MEQSTNIICDGSESLKLEKTLIITINMTTIAHRVDNDVRRQRNDDKRWAPFGPPDEFDVADTTVPAA